MNAIPKRPVDVTKPLSIAVMAMGGQGGGVLVDWIVALAESQDWVAQSTSVPGVAQRTGATIYYVEMIPARRKATYPVLSLMPVPGDVDVVIAAELMEAGRAMQRGLVTPDNTTLIASSHRSFAVEEKTAPGDGTADGSKVFDAAKVAAKRLIAFDMAQLAETTGSAISAVLFGALAASGALPLPREAFEATIRAAGVGVEPSLRAFAAGFDQAVAVSATAAAPAREKSAAERKIFPELAASGHPDYDALVDHARATFPPTLHGMVAAGLRRVVDYQDVGYGRDYLDLVAQFLLFERHGDPALTRAAAKHVAVAMAYDDVIRVADLKTRASRFARVRKEVQTGPEQLVYTTEYMHPRMEEVAGTLPARLGQWVEDRPRLFAALDRVVNRGRRVQTGTVRWFLPLYLLGGLKKYRRGTLRHRREVAHRDAWLDLAKTAAATDYALAVEIVETRRLVKGYSDTHARGASKFDKVVDAAAKLQGRADAAEWVRRLRQAALADENGRALDGALATVESFLR
jgi:indolepyruvate ferredoxin oxidoreductase beta subunit